VAEHRAGVSLLEEARAGVVFPEQVDHGTPGDLARLLTEPEHALQRCELAVDGGVGRLRLLTLPHVGEHALVGDGLGAVAVEELA
jgi:hypothetical protein